MHPSQTDISNKNKHEPHLLSFFRPYCRCSCSIPGVFHTGHSLPTWFFFNRHVHSFLFAIVAKKKYHIFIHLDFDIVFLLTLLRAISQRNHNLITSFYLVRPILHHYLFNFRHAGLYHSKKINIHINIYSNNPSTPFPHRRIKHIIYGF